MKYLITIIGPTAIGKTALSIQLAKHFRCDILSCDSRQFFKEMTIGTAVPNAEELTAVKHHFIHNKSVFENYTVGDFEKEVIDRIDSLFSNHDFLILVGGSGLYMDAVVKGFDDFPQISVAIRESVSRQYQENGIAYLQEQLQTLDSVYYEKIKSENPQTLQNPQRMMRFVEVCLGSGKPYSSYLNQKKKERNFIPIVIGLDADRAVLYERINQRVDLMVETGLLEEAKNLFPHKDLNALKTVGYRELFDYFENKISLSEAIEEIKKNTRRFAKRQLTWFKRNDNTKWFDYKTKTIEIIEYLKLKIK